MASTPIKVATGSDSFILTASGNQQNVTIDNPSQKEFRLTITIGWEEYRNPGQPAGTLWLEYLLGTNTPALPGIGAVVPIENASPKNNDFLLVTRGQVAVHYTGQANAHVWLSYYAEIPQ